MWSLEDIQRRNAPNLNFNLVADAASLARYYGWEAVEVKRHADGRLGAYPASAVDQELADFIGRVIDAGIAGRPVYPRGDA